MAVGRKIGNAVKRNRIRRVIRSACRDLAPLVDPWVQLVWLPRRNLGDVRNPDLREELRVLLQREGLIRC